MARPIALELPPRDPREELQRRLQSAPIEHAAALLDSYELIEQLHQKGIFQLLRGVLGAGGKLIDSAVETARSEESISAMRNALILAKMLGSINPDLLQGVAVAVGETLGKNRNPNPEPPGLFSLLNQFRHKELRRSISLLNRFLEKLGVELSRRPSAP